MKVQYEKYYHLFNRTNNEEALFRNPKKEKILSQIKKNELEKFSQKTVPSYKIKDLI